LYPGQGLLGDEAAALIGSLVIARVWQSVQRRAGLAAADRPTTFAFIDEFQDYLKIPMSIADLLAQARGLGLGLTLAHSTPWPTSAALETAVLSGARSRVIFQVSADDARKLARERRRIWRPRLAGAWSLRGRRDALDRIASGATGHGSHGAAPASTGQGAALGHVSRERYGMPREEVEAAIRRRHDGRIPEGSTGRREAQQ